MGKIYGKLFSILLLLISMSFYVSAFPTGAGTCNMDTQEIEGGHGASQLKSPAGYTVTTNMKSTGAFDFTVNGPGGGFKGILAYVIDGSGKRVGKFVSLPPTMQPKTCDDGSDPSATVTHTSDANKKFPFTLSWNAPQGTSGNLTVKALVVKDQLDYARLDAVKFDPASGASSAPAGSAPPPSSSQPTNTESDNFLQKYSLFLVMVGITTLLYVVGSISEAMLKRQQVKSRSFAKTINNGFENSR